MFIRAAGSPNWIHFQISDHVAHQLGWGTLWRAWSG